MLLSEDLRNILENSKIGVAQMVLDLANNDQFENNINYLDVAISDDSKISYITRDRANRFIKIHEIETIPIGKKIKLYGDNLNPYVVVNVFVHEDLSIEYQVKNHDCLNKTAERVFAIGPFNIKSYNNIKKETRNIAQEFFWDKTYRMKYAYMVSPAKILNKLGIECTDVDKQEFNKIFFSGDAFLTAKNLTMELVSGSDITDWYHEDNYFFGDGGGGGSLNGSCMRDDESQYYVSMYAKYPKQIQMLILKDIPSDKIRGRAIVWTCMDSNRNEEVKFMDRIYTDNYNFEQFFVSYAQASRWYYKREQTYSNCNDLYIPHNEYSTYVYTHLEIKLENVCNGQKFPYLDTFCSGDLHYSNDTLTLKNGWGGDLDFHHTSGGPLYEEETYSEYHDSYIPQDDAVWSNYLDSYIWYDRSVEVLIRGSWDRVVDDHEDICYVGDNYYLKEDCFYSEEYGDYIHEREGGIVELTNGDHIYLVDAIWSKFHNGYLLKNDAVYSEYHDGWYMEEDVVVSEYHNGSYVEEEFFDDFVNQLEKQEEESL